MSDAPSRQTWEYTSFAISTTTWFGTVKFDDSTLNELNNQLNAHGQEEWELVSLLDINHGHGSSRNVVAVFKRPVYSS